MAQQLTARHLPEIRAELAAWLDDNGPDGGPAAWSKGFETFDPATAQNERRAAKDWAVSLRAAELFFASKDMTELAVSAGLALPAYRLHPEDLPAQHGLLLWETPATDSYEGGEFTGCPIIGVSWAQRSRGVQIRTWCLRDDWVTFMAQGDQRAGLADLTAAQVRALYAQYPQQIVCMSRGFLPFGKVPGWLSDMPDDTSEMTLAELEDYARSAGRQQQAERALIVTWLLMGQTLSWGEDVPAPKSAVKAIRRLDSSLLLSARYVRLRRSVPVGREAAPEGAGRSYQYRWLVRGHWRNAWYPSRQAHRPVWISPHWKGPDGAPVLDPEKLVNVLRR
ncbi:hypothetical protein [Streptomyces sp. NPDC008150]|uniref:hypothetical protein n=1 Tax=Streptomyces sp. NPDC008150 TaxID=3364816 RepID=UPI0036EDA8E7